MCDSVNSSLLRRVPSLHLPARSTWVHGRTPGQEHSHLLSYRSPLCVLLPLLPVSALCKQSANYSRAHTTKTGALRFSYPHTSFLTNDATKNNGSKQTIAPTKPLPHVTHRSITTVTAERLPLDLRPRSSTASLLSFFPPPSPKIGESPPFPLHTALHTRHRSSTQTSQNRNHFATSNRKDPNKPKPESPLNSIPPPSFFY